MRACAEGLLDKSATHDKIAYLLKTKKTASSKTGKGGIPWVSDDAVKLFDISFYSTAAGTILRKSSVPCTMIGSPLAWSKVIPWRSEIQDATNFQPV